MRKSLFPMLTLSVLTLGLTTACAYEKRADPIALADDDSITLTGKAEKCINLSTMQNSIVIDDQTIDFRVGNKLYRNRLPHNCSGLKSEDRILIENRTGSLCSVDVVYTLYDHGGQLSRGAACGLGEFQPIKKVKK